MATFQVHTQEVEVKGHLIDSMILTRIFDAIMDLKGDFEVLEFQIGKLKTEPSYARLLVKGKSQEHLEQMLKLIYSYGATPVRLRPARLEPAPADGILPDDFYSTTNNPTFVYLDDEWVEVNDIMMDKAIVVVPNQKVAVCKPIRDVRKGDLVVVGEVGVKVVPPERPREGMDIFEFMGSKSSSEKPISSIAIKVAKDLYEIKRKGGKVVVVAGPSVVHTGAAPYLSKMIKDGYVDALLAGNALAVHDVEFALYGTSLGVNISTGMIEPNGHRNHMAAINEIFKAGSLKDAVLKGVVRRGIFYECVMNKVPYVLAGSIRDDGPIPDVITDVVEAQREYKRHLKDVELVLMLATMLHSIAVGNMLPSYVKTVVVDINPSTVTKLLDRGTSQAIGIVSDVGTFLPVLVQNLDKLRSGEAI